MSEATARSTLGSLAPGQGGYVYSVDAKDARMRRRIVDMGITPGMMRISVGTEDADDLIRDFHQALEIF